MALRAVDAPVPARAGNPQMIPGRASPNPAGKPRGAAGLARYAAERTNGGAEMIDVLLKLARDQNAHTPPAKRIVKDAAEAVLDRIVGKPTATVSIEREPPTLGGDLTGHTLEQLVALRDLLLAPARARHAGVIDARATEARPAPASAKTDASPSSAAALDSGSAGVIPCAPSASSAAADDLTTGGVVSSPDGADARTVGGSASSPDGRAP